MQIFIKVFGDTTTFGLDMEPSDTIDAVKQRIHDRAGVPPARQHLIFDGKRLGAGRTLAQLEIRAESTLQLVVPLR